MLNDTVVYSAVTSNYDMVFKPKIRTESVRYLLFSDRPGKVSGWEVMPIKNTIDRSSSLVNRWYKFFPCEILNEAEYSIYVDGNIRIIGGLGPLLQEFKESRAALGLFRHSERTNIFQEVDACVKLGKFDERDKVCVKNQLQVYSEEGMPLSQPLMDNGIIFRWHRHPKLSRAMSSWWEQLQMFSKRDQISLPYVVWKEDIPIKRWEWSFREENDYFAPYPHRRSSVMNLYTVIFLFRNDYWWLGSVYKWMNAVRRFVGL